MTEAEWQSCATKPIVMVRRVQAGLSPRKRQLLACGLCRLLPPEALEPWCREALMAAENFAEGELPAADYRAIAESVRNACDDLDMRQAVHGDVPEAKISAATAVLCACGTADVTRSLPALLEHVQRFDQLTAARGHKTKARGILLERQCHIVRDICLPEPGVYRRGIERKSPGILRGHEVLPIVDSVQALAEAIRADQAYERLSILADALEDSGFHDGPILHHLRDGGTHVRGCWAVDLLLGRN